MAKALSRIAND